jgi:hypothetical protein
MMNSTPILGRNGAAATAVANGLVRVMEGSATEELPGFRAALRDYEEMQDRIGFAHSALAILHVLGPAAVPEVRQWAEQALAIFGRVGAPGHVELVRKELARIDAPATPQLAVEPASVEA